MSTILVSVTATRNEDTSMSAGERPYLLVEDVVRIWTTERDRARGEQQDPLPPISPKTVWRYVGWSKEGGRYADRPLPQPERLYPTTVMAWHPAPGQTREELEQVFRNWWNHRPGRGAGGGRRPRAV